MSQQKSCDKSLAEAVHHLDEDSRKSQVVGVGPATTKLVGPATTKLVVAGPTITTELTCLDAN